MMLVLPMVAAPWEATLGNSQHSLILYFLGVAALTLCAGFIRAYVTRGEVGARYRGSTVARMSVMGVATLTYLVLVAMFVVGYDPVPGGWAPNEFAIYTFIPRYVDWSITVPLLCAELFAVSMVLGRVARHTQAFAMGGGFLMIFSGYIGAVIADSGRNPTMTLTWFAISTLFWIFTTVVLVRVVRVSVVTLTPAASSSIRAASVLLLGGWVIYPAVSLIQVVGSGGEWTAVMQIGLSIADIGIKVGFAGLIQRVAKLRTAEDVRAGADVHPESIWIFSVKQSDAGLAREVYLAEGANIHVPRIRPPEGQAVPVAEVRPVDDEAGVHI